MTACAMISIMIAVYAFIILDVFDVSHHLDEGYFSNIISNTIWCSESGINGHILIHNENDNNQICVERNTWQTGKLVSIFYISASIYGRGAI